MILLTAFEPFGGKTWNASSLILDKIDVAHKLLLPVSIKKLPEVIDTIDLKAFHAIVMLGEAGRDYLSLEQNAYNELDMRIADNDGIQINHEKLTKNGVTYKTPFELLKWVDSDTLISTDPGRYLCNMAYYLMSQKHDKVLFIHVSAETNTVDKQTLKIKEIIHEIEKITNAR